MINPDIRVEFLPHIHNQVCVCGERYSDFRSSSIPKRKRFSWAKRQVNGEWFFSRMVILYIMRATKIAEFNMKHARCERIMDV